MSEEEYKQVIDIIVKNMRVEYVNVFPFDSQGLRELTLKK